MPSLVGVCCKHGLKHHKKKQNSFKWCKDSMNAPPSDMLRNDSNKCRSGSVLCCDCCHIGFKASRLGRPYCDLAAHSSSGTCRDVLLDCCFEQSMHMHMLCTAACVCIAHQSIVPLYVFCPKLRSAACTYMDMLYTMTLPLQHISLLDVVDITYLFHLPLASV